MAKSTSHKLGQIIGNYFEISLRKFLAPLFTDETYYLDYLHPRKSRKNNKKVTWKDEGGHKHDLDYVIEKGGTEERIGELAAIIEVAWRTGGRHSANKCQEISGAVNPITELHYTNRAYKAAILAGEFTPEPISALISQGFDVVYFTKNEIKSAFADKGIDIMISDDDDDHKTQQQVDKYYNLNESDKLSLEKELYILMQPKMEDFTSRLMRHLDSKISSIIVGTTFSKESEFKNIESAIKYIVDTPENIDDLKFSNCIIYINFDNGGEVKISANNKLTAIEHLRRFI